MEKVKVRAAGNPDEPDAVQGACTCGEAGPETLNEENAKLWGVGHADGHKAVSKLK